VLRGARHPAGTRESHGGTDAADRAGTHHGFASLPSPPFTPEEKKLVAGNIYAHIWQQAMSGEFAMAP
jgi:hypothetical protein